MVGRFPATEETAGSIPVNRSMNIFKKVFQTISRKYSELERFATNKWADFAAEDGHTWLGHEELHQWSTVFSATPLLFITHNPSLAALPGFLFLVARYGREIMDAKDGSRGVDTIVDGYYNLKGFVFGYILSLIFYMGGIAVA